VFFERSVWPYGRQSGLLRLSGNFSVFLRTVRDAVDYEVEWIRRSVLRDIGSGIAKE